jgi:hypothetical protein
MAGLVVQPAWVEGVVHLDMDVGPAVPPWLVDRAMLAKERLVRQQMQERVDGYFWAWVSSQGPEWSFYDALMSRILQKKTRSVLELLMISGVNGRMR